MDTRAFDASVIVSALPQLLEFLDVTLLVGLSSILLGSLLGAVLAWAGLGRMRPLQYAARLYIYIMRCTPSIVMLFIVFYGLPVLVDELFHINMHDTHRGGFAIIAFTLLFSAYVSEIFRAAYSAVPRGQYEAAISVGISGWQAFWHIMLPQAAVLALPNFGNSVINLLKEGALAYTIGLIDMIGKGNLIIAKNFGAYGIEIYLACMLVYWLMSLGIEKGFGCLEKKLDKGQLFNSGNSGKRSIPAEQDVIWKEGEVSGAGL